MVAVLCRTGVEYREEQETKEPLVLFDLEALGIQQDRFLGDLKDSFCALDWDYYDVRREQLAIIQTELPYLEGHDDLFKRYYTGYCTLKALLAGLPALPTKLSERLSDIQPCRKRTTCKFKMTLSGSGEWEHERLPGGVIAQQVQGSDYRSIPRSFSETAVLVTGNSEFRRLLTGVADLTKQASDAVSMVVTCWQTGIIARPQLEGNNSPEGIHQDGADFIVSALVVDRRNIQGGTSRVFGPDKATAHLEVTLAPGQGIFQADAGSTLWHDVTPIRVENPESGEGVRTIFGFDIQVLNRGGS